MCELNLRFSKPSDVEENYKKTCAQVVYRPLKALLQVILSNKISNKPNTQTHCSRRAWSMDYGLNSTYKL